MKKVLITILAFFYLGVSSGATLHFHYCMGKLASWGLGHNEEEKCGSCGMVKTKTLDSGCCKDEQAIIKIDQAHKAAYNNYSILQPKVSVDIDYVHTAIPIVYIHPTLVENPLLHPPPQLHKHPLFICNCVFLI